MEMRYFWLLDREAQKYFNFASQPGQECMGDYPLKEHPGGHHTHVGPYYLHMKTSLTHLARASKPSSWRGCVGILGDPYDKLVPLPRIPDSCEQYCKSRGLIYAIMDKPLSSLALTKVRLQ